MVTLLLIISSATAPSDPNNSSSLSVRLSQAHVQHHVPSSPYNPPAPNHFPHITSPADQTAKQEDAVGLDVFVVFLRTYVLLA